MVLNKFFPLYVRYGIKVGIACLLAYAFSLSIGSQYSVWAIVATIVAMQLNVADSLQAGALRFTGTVFGAAIGVLLLLTLPANPWFLAAAVFFTCALCGYLARYTNLSSAISIAAMVVFVTGSELVSKAGYFEAVSFGLTRVLEIAIGVGSAFFVSLVLWPVRLMDTLKTDLGLQFLECARLLDSLLNAFLSGQQHLPYTVLGNMEKKTWDNHERLSRARKHESFLFHYQHNVMSVQVSSIDRTVEALRIMVEVLNDYDEEGSDPLIGNELRLLGDAIMAALWHLSSDNLAVPTPDLVRNLTAGVGVVEEKLAKLHQEGLMRGFILHKIMQILTFFQAMRLLAESLLIALDRLQHQQESKQGGRT